MADNINSSAPADLISTVPPDQTIAIIIPLYGYWKDVANPELNLEVLKYSLERVRSFFNKVYFLFPCETPRLDPEIMNYLVGKQLGGNAVGVQVDPFSTYSDYVNEGLDFALEETDARFLIVINPWIAVKEGAVDRMVNLLNRPDVALCSGYDLRKDGVPDTELDTFQFNPPKDLLGLDINFFGLSRPIAESVKIDPGYRTVSFLSRDYFEELTRKGFPSLLTQQVVFYSFSVTWSAIEDPGDFHEDHQRFLEKWHFDPEIKEENR